MIFMVDRNEMYDRGNIEEEDRVFLDMVLDGLDSVGLIYSSCAGRGNTEEGMAISLEGGIRIAKAGKVAGFMGTLVDEKGMMMYPLATETLSESRRHLLGHFVNELKEQGAEVLGRGRCENPFSMDDSFYKLKLKGRIFSLYLMRR